MTVAKQLTRATVEEVAAKVELIKALSEAFNVIPKNGLSYTDEHTKIKEAMKTVLEDIHYDLGLIESELG